MAEESPSNCITFLSRKRIASGIGVSLSNLALFFFFFICILQQKLPKFNCQTDLNYCLKMLVDQVLDSPVIKLFILFYGVLISLTICVCIINYIPQKKKKNCV